MALEPTAVKIIQEIAPGLPNRRVLCLGYPDLLVPEGELSDLPESQEADSIRRWHRWKGRVVSADAFFESLNLEPEYWDVTKARGPEKVVDLNEIDPANEWDKAALGPEMYGDRFALIIDPGTIEHVANVGNAWRTICAVTAHGGFAIHTNPLGMGNHGFWSIHPTAYHDFYAANGFEIRILAELSGPLDNRTARQVPPTKRFQMAQDGLMLCLAQKVEEKVFTWPIQSKYQRNPMLKG